MTRKLSPDVSAFLDDKAHPMRAEIDQLRKVILSAHPRLREAVKWGGPTFSIDGTKANLATITLRGKAALTLYFPEGAMLDDEPGLLKGEGAHVRTARFTSRAEIDKAKAALKVLVVEFVAKAGG